MRRGIILAVLFMLLCTACADSAPEPTPTPTPTPTPSGVPKPTPEPEQTPEPEELLKGTNPLTGLKMDAEYENMRPVAIMLNNLRKALPQYGVSKADIIYEVLAEGEVTRMVGIFKDPRGVQQIGSVRSTRPYYLDLAQGLDAILLHAGASEDAYSQISRRGVTAFDCLRGSYEGALYWRDARLRKERGLEHSAFTSGERIAQYLPTYKARLEHEEGYDTGLRFSENAVIMNGEKADKVSVTFSWDKTGVFEYDAKTGLYAVSEFGAPYIDGQDDSQVMVTNVLILRAEVTHTGDSLAHINVKLTGSGIGQYICGGKVLDIKWSKKSADEPFVYTIADDSPLIFKTGTSYVNIISKTNKVVIE